MKLIHIHGVWPLYTNTFLLITAAGHAVVVDPAAEAETYLAQLKENNATLTDIFPVSYTHLTLPTNCTV